MISALVVAAGQSKRMGKPKMLLPWGETTVIEKVVSTIIQAGVTDLYVVTGGNSQEVKKSLACYQVKIIFNPDYAHGEMLSSVQVGIRRIGEGAEAALIVLGDQPQIEVKVVRAILESYRLTRKEIIVPSYQMRRGHPWLIDRTRWNEISYLEPPDTLRDFLNRNQAKISYVNVDTPSILQDLDTPRDYQEQKPRPGSNG